MKLPRSFAVPLILSVLASASLANAQKWQALKNQPTFVSDTALVLTDGTVMVHEYCTSKWHRLTPDKQGSYLNGTWSTLASLPQSTGLCSSLLRCWRMDACWSKVASTTSAKERKRTKALSTIQSRTSGPTYNRPPVGVKLATHHRLTLSNGTVLLGHSGYLPHKASALFDAKTLTWTVKGKGKADGFFEEGMELLPNGMLWSLTLRTFEF